MAPEGRGDHVRRLADHRRAGGVDEQAAGCERGDGGVEEARLQGCELRDVLGPLAPAGPRPTAPSRTPGTAAGSPPADSMPTGESGCRGSPVAAGSARPGSATRPTGAGTLSTWSSRGRSPAPPSVAASADSSAATTHPGWAVS